MRTTVLATQPKRHTIRKMDIDLAKKQTNHLM
jgi:histone H3/H4